ncbi:hypothetical protein FRX31_008519 [Thalictrum thalictroides]|uniref:SEP domain-containing protein n=1 Tax=Thalictrum thalictroides TaxID=46969 RepID=A0A7J6WXU8_THATH|nr:hypothetical protein FRX31_008519 [Thalictrum thalictroides]
MEVESRSFESHTTRLPYEPYEGPDYDYDEDEKPDCKYIERPDYNENFFCNVDYMEYFCNTSGSDGGKLCQNNCFGTNPPVDYHHDILLLKEDKGFTINGGPLWRFDDPLNRQFLDAIYHTEFPKELDPKVEGTKLHRITIRRPETHKDSLKVEPPTISRLFEPGTPQEILDAAVADNPDSILIPIDSSPAGTRLA